MFQVQYYLMDFDEILYEHMPKPVLSMSVHLHVSSPVLLDGF